MTRLSLCLLTLVVSVGGCDASQSGPVDPDRVALLRIQLRNTADSLDATTITAEDPDGNGRWAFSRAPLLLRPGADYDGAILALETAGGEDLVAAIRARPDEYVFQFHLRTTDCAPYGCVNSTVYPTDRERDYDPDGRELWGVGLRFGASVAGASSGGGHLGMWLKRYEPGTKTEYLSESTVYIELPTFLVEFASPCDRC